MHSHILKIDFKFQINEVLSLHSGEVWQVVFIGRQFEEGYDTHILILGVEAVTYDELVSYEDSIEKLEDQIKD